MPDTLPATAPTRAPVDDFIDRVMQAVHRRQARTVSPFAYSLSHTADFTGLPVQLLRRLCRDGELHAIKHSGWWLLHRAAFHLLLAPEVTFGCRLAHR